MPELGSSTRKKGRKERPISERKRESCRANGKLAHPGGVHWREPELAARVEAVRKLRHLTPMVVDKIAEMIAGPLQPIELATLARVVFNRAGLPEVSELELTGDQPIAQTLVITYAQRQALLAGREDEASAAQVEQPGTNGTNGTAH
jgi:hypothetical protein